MVKLASILLNNFHREHIFTAEINRPNRQCDKRRIFFMIYSDIYGPAHEIFGVYRIDEQRKLRRNCARLSSTAGFPPTLRR